MLEESHEDILRKVIKYEIKLKILLKNILELK